MKYHIWGYSDIFCRSYILYHIRQVKAGYLTMNGHMIWYDYCSGIIYNLDYLELSFVLQYIQLGMIVVSGYNLLLIWL